MFSCNDSKMTFISHKNLRGHVPQCPMASDATDLAHKRSLQLSIQGHQYWGVGG